MMRFGTALKLARISNLPTVWSNVLAAAALTGNALSAHLAMIALGMSFLYVGGMFLNDAFDSEVDARERPNRPIPAGEASRTQVFAIGFGAIAAGVLIVISVSAHAAPWVLILAAAILIYDWSHKGNPVAPLIMGACRALVYVATAAALNAPIERSIVIAALVLLAYVAGLTYAAKQEALNKLASAWPLALLAVPFVKAFPDLHGSWSAIATCLAFAAAVGTAVYWLNRRKPGDVGRAVSLLIAAIALNDALVAMTAGATEIGVVCVAFCFMTLFLQRFVPGT
jgi:4-hydroxybenzoate polyprenyltransferase